MILFLERVGQKLDKRQKKVLKAFIYKDYQHFFYLFVLDCCKRLC